MAKEVLGQFDPASTAIVAETQDLLRLALRRRDRPTIPVSGTSGAGMEAALVTLVEPGALALAAENGRFGLLFEEIAGHAGLRRVPVRSEDSILKASCTPCGTQAGAGCVRGIPLDTRNAVAACSDTS